MRLISKCSVYLCLLLCVSKFEIIRPPRWMNANEISRLRLTLCVFASSQLTPSLKLLLLLFHSCHHTFHLTVTRRYHSNRLLFLFRLSGQEMKCHLFLAVAILLKHAHRHKHCSVHSMNVHMRHSHCNTSNTKRQMWFYPLCVLVTREISVMYTSFLAHLHDTEDKTQNR